jgi:hypothetical protein
MKHILQTRRELLAILDDIKSSVERDDSFEGSIEYELREPLVLVGHGSFAVRASYRVGNSQGQGGLVMVGDTSEAS